MYNQDQLLEILSNVEDPDIGQPITDIGLIYEAKQEESGDVRVKMTLTSQFCPMGDVIKEDVKKALESDPNINQAYVEMVFDPPWTPEKMTEDLRIEFGFNI